SLCVTERRAAGLRDEPGAVKADGASAARIRLEPAIGRSATAVVATNSAEVSGLASLGVQRSSIRVVPWGVDTGLFTPEGPVARRNGRSRLLATADLTERKPLDTPLRAMACGAPVLAPPVGGHMDAVVDGTTGIIVQPDRPALLAQRIRQLLAHPMLIEAYGVAAADRVRSRYSWDRIAGETIAVYDRVMAQAA